MWFVKFMSAVAMLALGAAGVKILLTLIAMGGNVAGIMCLTLLGICFIVTSCKYGPEIVKSMRD